MDLFALMRKARSVLNPHWGLAVLVCFLYAVIVGGPSKLNTYGEVLTLLLAGPMQLGLNIYFLKIANQQQHGIENFIEGFKPLLNVLLVYFSIVILTMVGLLLFIVPGFIIAIGLSMTYFIMAEHPEIAFTDALQESWKLTDGHKWELFLLNLRFIPWYLLGLLCLIVGIFVVIPWHQTTLAMYYEHLKNQSAKKDLIL